MSGGHSDSLGSSRRKSWRTIRRRQRSSGSVRYMRPDAQIAQMSSRLVRAKAEPEPRRLAAINNNHVYEYFYY